MNSLMDPTVLAALATGGLAWLGIHLGRRGERENALIDQLQEERKEDRALLDETRREVDGLRRELYALMSREGLWALHSGRIEQQVLDLGGEPHPRPQALLVLTIDSALEGTTNG